MTAASEITQVELAVGGMTCAACAARVQARLNKVTGVTASVNYATAIAQKGMHVGLNEVVTDRMIANVSGMRALNTVGPVVFTEPLIWFHP